MALTLKKKLTLCFMVTGIIPMAVVVCLSYFKARSELEKAYLSKVEAIADTRREEVKKFFDDTQNTLKNLSEDEDIHVAFRKFTRSFYAMEGDARTEVTQATEALERFYRNDFAKAYVEKSAGGIADPTSIYTALDNSARFAQYAYLARNPDWVNRPQDMKTSPVSSTYQREHEHYHSIFKVQAERNGLSDIYLLTPDQGRVIYSIKKRVDFGTSLTSGPFVNSGLARAFEAAKKLKNGETYFEDYALYAPFFDIPAAFMSSPVYDSNELLGYIVVRIPLAAVSSVISQRVGLGNEGESYLVGLEDGLLRTDTFRNKDTYNVLNAYRHPEQYRIGTEAFRKAKTGTKGVEIASTYDGRDVIGAYSVIEVFGRKWGLFVEDPEEEIFAGLTSLNHLMLFLLVVTTALVGFAGLTISKGLAKRLTELATALGASSVDLASASDKIAATSTELSEASTEQAASLQETVASVEEISAMVNQNAEAASKSNEASKLSRQEAEEGRKTAGEMMSAVLEIKSSNDEILQQMETSNKEIAEIVKVIGEIGDKTKVINDIVFQTKLLSFNASVEAARAGEHGKGFAVVAEEVGNLAQMSGDASKEISSMLISSMQKVEAIVERTTEKVDRLVTIGREKVALGQSTAQKCRDSLERILTQVASVNDMVVEISGASREQAQGIQEITKAVNQLDQVTQQNAMASQQSSTQAEALNHQAVDLNSLVNELLDFVDGTAGAPHAPKVTKPAVTNVVSIAAKKVAKVNAAPLAVRPSSLKEKKVVGLRDPVVPSSDDPRFEDF